MINSSRESFLFRFPSAGCELLGEVSEPGAVAAGPTIRFEAPDPVPTASGSDTHHDRAHRRIASADTSMSASVVDQFEIEIRIACMPCQVVPPNQQVPSS